MLRVARAAFCTAAGHSNRIWWPCSLKLILVPLLQYLKLIHWQENAEKGRIFDERSRLAICVSCGCFTIKVHHSHLNTFIVKQKDVPHAGDLQLTRNLLMKTWDLTWTYPKQFWHFSERKRIFIQWPRVEIIHPCVMALWVGIHVYLCSNRCKKLHQSIWMICPPPLWVKMY